MRSMKRCLPLKYLIFACVGLLLLSRGAFAGSPERLVQLRDIAGYRRRA